MNAYKHTQFGCFIWVPVVVAAIILFVTGLVEKASYLMCMSALLFLITIIFSTLTVSVDEKKIRIAFGIGLIRKNFFLRISNRQALCGIAGGTAGV